jgi:putative transposase
VWAKRDAVAAKAFFKKAIKENARPNKVTIDKSGSNTAALNACNEIFPEEEKIKNTANQIFEQPY